MFENYDIMMWTKKQMPVSTISVRYDTCWYFITARALTHNSSAKNSTVIILCCPFLCPSVCNNVACWCSDEWRPQANYSYNYIYGQAMTTPQTDKRTVEEQFAVATARFAKFAPRSLRGKTT